MTILKAKPEEQIKKEFLNAWIFKKLAFTEKKIGQIINSHEDYLCEVISLLPRGYNVLSQLLVYKLNIDKREYEIYNRYYIIVTNDFTTTMLTWEDEVIKEFNELNYEAYKGITNYFKNS